MHEQMPGRPYVMDEFLNPEDVNAQLEAMFGPDAFGEASHDAAIHGLGNTALAPLTEGAIEAETAAAFAFHDAQFTSEELAAAARQEDLAVVRVAEYYAQRQQQEQLDNFMTKDKKKDDKKTTKQPLAAHTLTPRAGAHSPHRGSKSKSRRKNVRPLASHN